MKAVGKFLGQALVGFLIVVLCPIWLPLLLLAELGGQLWD